MAKSIELYADTSAALKAVCDLLPEWKEVRLANKILREACAAILTEGPAKIPTVDYLREQLGRSPIASPIEELTQQMQGIRYDLDAIISSRVNEEPAAPTHDPPRKQRAS